MDVWERKGMFRAKRLLALLLATVFLVAVPSYVDRQASADLPNPVELREPVLLEDDVAEDLTAHCSISAERLGDPQLERLTDGKKNTGIRMQPGGSLTISWPVGVPVAAVFFAFNWAMAEYTVLQHDACGALLEEQAGAQLWNNRIATVAGARSVTIRAEEAMQVITLAAYGKGSIPDYLPWKPTPEKADFMLVATHPDDDVLFLGAIIPIFGAEQGREGVAVFVTASNRVRVDEAMQGAWAMGLRTLPIFCGFPDMYTEEGDSFSESKLLRCMVMLMRRFQPEVVVTQDIYGEYGHWHHCRVSRATLRAAAAAAHDTVDVVSLRTYGVWEVKKVYLHLYKENRISLPVTQPLAAFGGKTAFEVARDAFSRHVSQAGKGRHAVTNEGVYSLSDFGLAYTVVGADTSGVNDIFENIDPEAIRSNRP